MEQFFEFTSEENNGPPKALINKYEINPLTMAIFPINYGSKVYSKILEFDDEYISPSTPLQIIKEACGYFGVPYKGRKDGTKQMIGASRKIPIAISPTNSMYFFPTTSPDRPECIWVNYQHVNNYVKSSKDATLVLFSNNQSLEVPISRGSFNNQMAQTDTLRRTYSQRIEAMNLVYQNKMRLFEVSEKRNTYRDFPEGF